ncbi:MULTISPECIES: hypothetical protein [Kordiimonas]|uniref:hypothetical protein n=1 Tax=Kordiimonas TaxID=288021 RepID=UPI00257E9D89|nr:hypothetical protein [Kordiimonas sp. UBA4487]
MKMISKLALFSSVVILGLTVALSWYSGTSQPLSSKEVASYMARMHPAVFKSDTDKQAFRQFLEQDDGGPFYTVNFYKYHDVANYDDAETLPLSGQAAFERFSSVMVPLLARQASHPIFGSNWVGANPDGFERLVIVRYRSRRDIAEVFSNPSFAAASRDKWAAIEKNNRFLVQGLHIPALPYVIALLAMAILLIPALVRKIRHYLMWNRPNPTSP